MAKGSGTYWVNGLRFCSTKFLNQTQIVKIVCVRAQVCDLTNVLRASKLNCNPNDTFVLYLSDLLNVSVPTKDFLAYQRSLHCHNQSITSKIIFSKWHLENQRCIVIILVPFFTSVI